MKTELFLGKFTNREELCREFSLNPDADPELLAQGFKRAGNAFLFKCNGLFSFVLTDEENGCQYFGRDRFGGKGLYYSFNENGAPVFSGTISGILSQRKRAEFRETLLEVYLSYSYIPGEDTAFEGIWKPLPGYCYCVKDNGKNVSKERFFTPKYETQQRTEQEWETLLSATLDDIFDARGKGGTSMLSSGIDSSYLCKRLGVENTYTAAYENASFSEADAAALYAQKIGAKPHAVAITPESYLALVPDTMRILEQPTGDASAEVLLSVCRKIKEDGYDACYSGEGIDELFLGYYMDDLKKIEEGRNLASAGYIGSTSAFSEEEKKRLLKHYAMSHKMEATEEAYALSAKEDRLRQAALVDILVWLNGNLLPNVFGMEQGTGLHLEAPYLDNRLYDLALRIPSKLQKDDKLTKKLFRKAAARVLDAEYAIRPKRGFPVPIRLWIRTEKYEKELKRVFTSPVAEHFFHTDVLLAMYDKMAADPEDRESWQKLWSVYCFLIWYDEMIDRGAVVL